MLNIKLWAASILTAIGALIFAYFKGRSASKNESELGQLKGQLINNEAIRVVREIVSKEVIANDSKSNDKNRDELIASLMADSMRKPGENP